MYRLKILNYRNGKSEYFVEQQCNFLWWKVWLTMETPHVFLTEEAAMEYIDSITLVETKIKPIN